MFMEALREAAVGSAVIFMLVIGLPAGVLGVWGGEVRSSAPSATERSACG